MVHNLYLNKLSYQSRCSILNELLDSKKNHVICDLLKDMLRDSDQGRPTAAQLLSKNRTIHYFSYISDNQLENKHLPSDINLLQVFSSNELFIPLLIQFGMQNLMNKSKAVISFFTLMTMYIKTSDESRILHSIITSKAYIQIVELLNFCQNTDLKPIMHFFNQNLNTKNNIENLQINEILFQTDFAEQKQAGLEILVKIIKMNCQPSIDSQNQPLFGILQDMT